MSMCAWGGVTHSLLLFCTPSLLPPQCTYCPWIRDLLPRAVSKVKLRWTQAWRRQNKKGKVEEGGKKKARKAALQEHPAAVNVVRQIDQSGLCLAWDSKAQKFQKAIVGMSLDDLKKKQQSCNSATRSEARSSLSNCKEGDEARVAPGTRTGCQGKVWSHQSSFGEFSCAELRKQRPSSKPRRRRRPLARSSRFICGQQANFPAKKQRSDTSGSCEGKPAVAKGKADKAGTVGQDLFR